MFCDSDQWQDGLEGRVPVLVVGIPVLESHLLFFLLLLDQSQTEVGNVSTLDELSKWRNGVYLAAIVCYKFIMHYAEKCSCVDNVGKKL